MDALDSAEYSGSLIILLNEGVGFVKRNMKTRWKKTANSRIEMPDYCERSVFEALVNALIHRDYLILGSEVHIDIYDDRLTITSPGGMADGTRIQERDISNISSTRRNPVLADIFGRLGYMERQGSGFKKITESYRAAHNYRDELEPKFYSDASSFQVTLYNLNYGTDENGAVGEEKVVLEQEKVAFEAKKAAFERSISELKLNKPTKDNILSLFESFGYDVPFSRADVIGLCGLAPSSAGKMLSKIKEFDLTVPVTEQGRGKYIFIEAKNNASISHPKLTDRVTDRSPKRYCPLSATQPITGIQLSIYKFGQDDFLRTVADVVFTAYPFHLICRFECFGHALLLRHSGYDDFHTLVAGLVDL